MTHTYTPEQIEQGLRKLIGTEATCKDPSKAPLQFEIPMPKDVNFPEDFYNKLCALQSEGSIRLDTSLKRDSSGVATLAIFGDNLQVVGKLLQEALLHKDQQAALSALKAKLPNDFEVTMTPKPEGLATVITIDLKDQQMLPAALKSKLIQMKSAGELNMIDYPMQVRDPVLPKNFMDRPDGARRISITLHDDVLSGFIDKIHGVDLSAQVPAHATAITKMPAEQGAASGVGY